MNLIRKILCPVDFAPASESALATARGMAEKFGASIDVFHAVELPLYAVAPEFGQLTGNVLTSLIETSLAEAKKKMDALLLTIPSGERAKITTVVELGTPSESVLAKLNAKNGAAEPYDLVVLGTHGRTGLAHFFLGSVAERVVRRAPCPVLIVRDQADAKTA